MDEIRFIDGFSGVGGIRQGLELSGGYRCVWSNDINKYANQIYIARFGEENHHPGDIRRVNTRDIPDHDLFCGGFPCQAFSIAGKRKGFQDPRGTLFFQVHRIIKDKRPKLLLLENVEGLLSAGIVVGTGIYKATKGEGKGELTDDIQRLENESRRGWKEITVNVGKGYVLTEILLSLLELGYWVEYQVLNSKYFGVPQNRGRVFIIGHLGEGSTKPVFPITEADGVDYEGNEGQEKQLINCIDGNYFKGIDKHGQRTGIAVSFMNPHNSEENRKANFQDITRALKSYQGNQQPYIIADRTRTKQNLGRQIEPQYELTNTLTGTHHKDNYLINPSLETYRIRRLTPVECERLQGFPDGWTEGISDTQRYKCIGNAVTVNVIEFLGHKIKECVKNGRTATESDN